MKKILIILILLILGCEQQERISLDSISESNQSVILIKNNCYWDNPGRSHWKGDSKQLLINMGLNENQTQSALNRIQNIDYDSKIIISAKSIYEKTYPFRTFHLSMDMSSGEKTLCLNTIPGRKWEFQEYDAKLYVIDHTIYIIVPEVCGNISRVYVKSIYRKGGGNFKNNENDNGSSIGQSEGDIGDTKSVSSASTLFLLFLGYILLFTSRHIFFKKMLDR